MLGYASLVKDGVVKRGGVSDINLAFESNDSRVVKTSLGYEVHFEAGGKLAIAELEGKSFANVDLDAEALDGAVGDARANNLSAFGHSRSVQIVGRSGNDALAGSDNDDMLSGDEGADNINGWGGNDLIFLDAEDLAAGKGVSGDSGIDTAIIAEFATIDDVTTTASEARTAVGVNLNLLDHMFEAAYGGDGNDTLDGRGLSDDLPLFGGKGNDLLHGGDGDDDLSGDTGADLAYGWNGDDHLNGGDGYDTLNGNAGSDILSGGKGNDNLAGGSGDDMLLADVGEDLLNGGHDDDRIDGGDGNDS